jgi:hypothetical protein
MFRGAAYKLGSHRSQGGLPIMRDDEAEPEVIEHAMYHNHDSSPGGRTGR